jgi:hypothetical protein
LEKYLSKVFPTEPEKLLTVAPEFRASPLESDLGVANKCVHYLVGSPGGPGFDEHVV